MSFNCGDYVKIKEEKEVYVITNITSDEITLKGFTHRSIKKVNVLDLEAATEDDVNNEIAYSKKVFERVVKSNSLRYSKKFLYGRILHIDGDKEFLDTCLLLYKKLHIEASGIYIEEENVKDYIEDLILSLTPDIVVITGHDFYNGKGVKDLSNYEHSKDFISCIRIIRKHFDFDSMVIIAGACGSHFEALLASGANFSSSPKRINIHTYDPAILAIKVASTSCNRVINFEQALELIENKKEAFGGIETKGKMKILL